MKLNAHLQWPVCVTDKSGQDFWRVVTYGTPSYSAFNKLCGCVLAEAEQDAKEAGIQPAEVAIDFKELAEILLERLDAAETCLTSLTKLVCEDHSGSEYIDADDFRFTLNSHGFR